MPFLSIISLPANFVASTTESMSTFFTDLAPITMLILGIILAVTVIEIIIGALRHKG